MKAHCCRMWCNIFFDLVEEDIFVIIFKPYAGILFQAHTLSSKVGLQSKVNQNLKVHLQKQLYVLQLESLALPLLNFAFSSPHNCPPNFMPVK